MTVQSCFRPAVYSEMRWNQSTWAFRLAQLLRVNRCGSAGARFLTQGASALNGINQDKKAGVVLPRRQKQVLA